MTMEELRGELLTKKFTHINITDERTKNTITRRIIKVDSEGCTSISYLSQDLKIYRRLPENNYVIIDNGYIENLVDSKGNKIKVRIQFTTNRRNHG